MTATTKSIFPYDSLSKYTESLLQCPICNYYIKVNPQTDSMKYRMINKEQIQFLTQHNFNTSIHTVIIEYLKYSFSKIIDAKESSNSENSTEVFPLFHLVNLLEYKKFRERVLELESNNNDLISNFKSKLEKLELCYNQKDDEILLLDQTKNISNVQNSLLESELAILRDKFLVTIQSEINSLKAENANLLVELLGNRIELNNSLFNNNQLQDEIKDLQDSLRNITTSLNQITNENMILTQKVKSLKQQEQIPLSVNSKPDPRLLELLDQERQQKRIALREKKELETKNNELKEKVVEFERKFQITSDSNTDQLLHEYTLTYETKISDLTLKLADKEEEIKELMKTTEMKPKMSNSDRQFRITISNEFLELQKKFNEIQFDIMLSFYNTENINPQLRNAFEKFFGQLITKANESGQILLNDNDFTLFKELRELNPRLKFTTEQYQAGLRVQALNIIFSDLCKYIFAIIKSVKADMEGSSFQIVPDDAERLTRIESVINQDTITFIFPYRETMKLSDTVRIFRPNSELYRNSVIFISFDPDITLHNTNYQLVPHTLTYLESEEKIALEIQNFFSFKDSFQMGSYEDDTYLIIQKIDLQHDLNLIKNFAEKNKINF